jgi:PleD family two-component response regulator
MVNNEVVEDAMRSHEEPSNRAPRTAVIVTGHAESAGSLDSLSIQTSGYDVVFIESIAHGYSRITQVAPDLVVIGSEIDDVATCQLLSMLKMDSRASRIPVLAALTPAETELQAELIDLDGEPGMQFVGLPLN